MRGVYEANIKCSAVSAAKTLLYLTAPANKVVEILSASVTTVGSNVTNQQLEVDLQKVNALGTPAGTALTPSKAEQGDQAAGSTVVGNVTASEPTYVSNTAQGYRGATSLGGWEYAPIPEERAYVAGGDSWGIRLLNAPTSTDIIVRLCFREIG